MQKLEELKETKIPVLDKGFIKLIDVMGNDDRVCQAARLTAGDLKGTSRFSNRTLLRYLYRHWHGTPFEFVTLVLHIKVPMDVMRQWTRHRTWKYLSINEYSTRYSEAIDSMQQTPPDKWRKQSKSNRQGSDGYIEADLGEGGDLDGEFLTYAEETLQEKIRMTYQERLEAGVALEQARKDLPLCTYTELWVEADLRNILEFLTLRMDTHAQEEIREFATALGEQVIAPLFPTVWEAFEDYRLHAITLSRLDILAMNIAAALAVSGESVNLEAELENIFSNKRELNECKDKLKLLGIS